MLYYIPTMEYTNGHSPNFLNPGKTTAPSREATHTPPHVLWSTPVEPKKRWRLRYVIVLGVLLAGGAAAAYYLPHEQPTKPATAQPTTPAATGNSRVDFLLEIFDQVKQRYWDKIDEATLGGIYQRGLAKLTNSTVELNPPTRVGLEALLTKTMQPMSEAEQKTLAVSLGDVVLANLNPFSRSRLYSTKNEQALQNEVNNTDPTTDLYHTLGVSKTATSAEITKAFEQRSSELKQSKATDAADKLAQVGRAYSAVGTAQARTQYDKSGVEPTVTGHIVQRKTLALKITRISPPTVQELAQVADSFAKHAELTYLVLDIRGNIGGDIDILPYFLGLFLGPDAYAYEFYHQGDTTPYKTKVAWLPSLSRFKQVVVLIDENTQSSAEVIADTLKKYHIGVLVGTKSKGWGTVESVVPLQTVIDPTQTYSMLLVHSVTVRNDGQAIEGRGVEPQVKLTDKNWPSELLSYYNFPDFVAAVRELIGKLPAPPAIKK